MVLAELAAYLEAQGIGTRATDIFYGLLPEAPDACIAMFEYGGLRNEPQMGTTGGTTTRLEMPRVQVVCRGVKDDYDGPRQKAQDVLAALTKVVSQNLSGVRYVAVEPVQAPFFLKRDDNFRVQIVCNYQIMKEFSAS